VSVLNSVVDVEIVELAGRAVAAELLRLGVAFGAGQQVGQKVQMLGPHLLFDAIGAEALHLAAHEQPRLVQAVAQRLARIAADDEVPACAMKADMCPILPCTTMSIPFIEMPQRELALPLMTSSPPWPVAPGILAGVALHDDGARHHVLGHARPGGARHPDVACLFMPPQ
jgi:hypothetical protein